MVWKVDINTGATVRVKDFFYKEILRSLLLYERESWVVTGTIL